MRGLHSLALVLGLTSAACDPPAPEPKVETAARADLAIRQLIAGLNADQRDVVASLVVLTSSTGGPPRALTASELARLTFPPGPYAYFGAERPGTMTLVDGKKEKRIVRLVRVGDGFKVLATSTPASTLFATDARLLTLFATASD